MTENIMRNHRTPEGAEMGKTLAKWADEAEPKARLIDPAIPPRCASCAFREGNHLASGSPYTQMDALKCLFEHIEFDCHDVHREGSLCSGYAMLRLAEPDAKPMQVEWEFSGGFDKKDLPK